MMIYQYPNYLMHHGVKGMKWGVRRKANKLTRLSNKADLYERKSNAWKNEAQAMDRAASELGPIAYGQQYNRIKQANANSKQLKKYAKHYEKKTNSYIKKLSENYKIAYDVTTKQYQLTPR